MTPVKHTWRSKSGGYYFRYTLPRSFRRFDCRSKKSIYLSLRTHDPKKAKVVEFGALGKAAINYDVKENQ